VRLTVRPFQVPKIGNVAEECEDAFFWDEAKQLFAIADGATDSAFQRLWAMLLVKGFVSHPPNFSKSEEIVFGSPPRVRTWFGGWLQSQQEKWNESIDWDNIPWHGQNKARQIGGLATFMGIHLSSNESLWRGIAIGDCNLFQFRKETDWYVTWWGPLIYADEFGTNPAALSSISKNYAVTWNYVTWIAGQYYPGDVIVLTTDALGAWLTSAIWERQRNSWQSLLNLQSQEEFSRFIDNLRKEKNIKNDDTSMLTIQID